MAQVLNGQVHLNNGQVIAAPQTGAWYDGQQYWNGSLSNPGQFNQQNNQPGQQGGAAPVQSADDAAYLVQRGDTSAPQRVVNNGAPPSNSSLFSGNGADTSGGGLSIPKPPTIDLQGIYDSAYTNNPDVAAARKAIDDTNAKITQRQQAQADAAGEINDNPFYSEATRTGKLQEETNASNNDIGVLQNQAKMQQDKLTMMAADAQAKVNVATGQYNINNTAYQENLSTLNSLLSSGALSGASSGDIASIAVSTGISTNLIQGMVTASQNAQMKPQVITSTDDSGNVTAAVIDAATGKVISKQSLGNVGQSKTYSNGSVSANLVQAKAMVDQAFTTKQSNGYTFVGADGKVSPQTYQAVKQQWLGMGLPANTFDQQFSGYINPNDAKDYNITDPSTRHKFNIY